MKKIDWLKYVTTFVLTAGIFVTVILITNTVNQKKFAELKLIQDKISIDLLSSETQFALLKQSECTADGNSILAPQIGELGERLSKMEQDLGIDDDRVIQLKKYYSLLQIKDYLLMKELSQKCAVKPITIVYFYNNTCSDCGKQGDVLTALRIKYPELRVYSFNADLDLSAITTFQTVTKTDGITYPAIVMNNRVYSGFQPIENIEKIITELKKIPTEQNKKDIKSKNNKYE